MLDGSTLPPFGVEIGFKKRTGLLCDLLDAPGPPPCAEREVYSIWKHPPVRFAGQDFLTLLRTLPPFAYLASQSTYIIPPSVERSLPTSHYDPSRPLRAITTHHITSYTPLWALTPNQRSSQCHQLATRSPDQPTNKNTQLTLRTHRPSHRQESTGARHKSWNPHTSKLNRHRHSRERCRSGKK